MTKPGRPTTDPKTFKISIRLTKESKNILENYCEQKQINTSNAVAKGIEKLKQDLKK